MARRENELFIGREHINIEGRTIKHCALIKEYATTNINKIKEDPINLIGLDLETNAETGELKLLGFWNGKEYRYYTEDFLSIILMYMKYLNKNNCNIAYWNRLDPFILYKQFLLMISEEEAYKSLSRFGKISGEWDRKEAKWKVKPVIELETKHLYFGIQTAIRSSVKFFYRKKGSPYLNTVWAYDIAQLFERGLEAEAQKRLPYYSKVDKSAHIVEWNKFESNKNYRENIVLKSNELDARAVYDLGYIIQEEFKKAFKWYPNTLVSSGSLARASIVAVLYNKYYNEYKDEKIATKHALNDIKSIGIINYLDKWNNQYGGEFLKDLYCLSTECYSGGYIESLMYGYTKRGYYADIASAYPAIIKQLYDLRGCKITKGYGEPPHIENSYCFIRGIVNIPYHINYHPITIKHPLNKDTNIRAVGTYRASYTIEERDYLLKQGATFEEETYYNIQTKGELSPLANVEDHLLELRKHFLNIGDSAQYIAKKTANSGYGILFEAVDTYEEEEEEAIRAGYRAGELFNPIYATIITSRTRLLISEACQEIYNNGGKPILVMTDSIFWEGSKEMLPKRLYKDIKTVGYFEAPEEVSDIVCLGSGRYSYRDNKKGIMLSKKRGLNVTDIHRPEGIDINEFNWLEALKIAKFQKSTEVNVIVRTLISVGVILHNSNYDIEDLGRVVEQDREVDLLVGKTKRFYPESVKDPELLSKSLINTKSIYFDRGMYGDNSIEDQTLPLLREMIKDKKVVTAKERNLKNRCKAQKKYAKKKKVKKKVNEDLKKKYKQLLGYGYSSQEAKRMQGWSFKRITNKLMEDSKI